jgi:hypothetical protein
MGFSMMPTDVTSRYFRLSNASDMAGIGELLDETTTYRSGNGDFFLGSRDILVMQRAYHGSFKRLAWTVTDLVEIRPGIVRLEFDFAGENHADEPVAYSGVEHVIVRDGIIVHIDVVRKGGG